MGLYPATPDYRIAYHRDGSAGFLIDASNVITQMTGQQLLDINDESSTSEINIVSYTRFGILFAHPMDISRYFCCLQRSYFPGILETSPDTTNGLDGNWTTRVNPFVVSDMVLPYYRSTIQTVSAATGIKGIRFNKTGDCDLTALHLYGKAGAAADDWLRLWHPTLDQELAPDAFYQGTDTGDPNQGQSFDVTFRVKNTAAAGTANSVAVSTEGLSGSSVAAGWIVYSTGGAFSASQNLGTLAPGAISGVVTARIVIPSAAPLGQQSPRTVANANSWT